MNKTITKEHSENKSVWMGKKVMLDIYTNLDLDVLGQIGWKENLSTKHEEVQDSLLSLWQKYTVKKINLTFTASVCIWKSLSLNFLVKQ